MWQIARYTSPRPMVASTAKQQHRRGTLEEYSATVMMLSMSQIVQDLVGEMRNLPEMRGRFRWEFATVSMTLDQLRKRIRRCLPQDVADRFEEMLCDIADEVEPYVAQVRTSLKAELVNKISWEKIDTAILTGLIGGFIDTMQQVNQRLAGRERYDFKLCHDQMKAIEDKVGFTQMNEGVEPDFRACRTAMERMYCKLGETISEKVRETKI